MDKTDKIKTGLADFYSEVFIELKEKKINLLELGIYKGGSLTWLNDYFNDVEITGIDWIVPNIEVPDNIKMFECKQDNYPKLIEIAQQRGDFDIILDDCSHKEDLTWGSFITLWRYLKPGGIYVIEDWCAGFCPYKHYSLYLGLQNVISRIIENADRLGIKEVRAVKLPQGGSTTLIYKN